MKYRLFLTVPLVAHYSCELVVEAEDEREAYEKYQAMSWQEIEADAVNWKQHAERATPYGVFDLDRVEEGNSKNLEQ